MKESDGNRRFASFKRPGLDLFWGLGGSKRCWASRALGSGVRSVARERGGGAKAMTGFVRLWKVGRDAQSSQMVQLEWGSVSNED